LPVYKNVFHQFLYFLRRLRLAVTRNLNSLQPDLL